MLGEVVIRGHIQRVLKQRFAVFPVLDLGRGNSRRGQTCRNGRGGDRTRRSRPPPRQIGGAPSQHDGEADHRNIHVPVGACLRADLHQSDYRRQRHQEPEPAGGQVGGATKRSQRERRDDGDCQPGSRYYPPFKAGRIRIEHRQPGRPNRLEAVDGVGDQRVLHPQPDGQPRDFLDGAARLLHQERRHGRNRGEREERNLLDHRLSRKPAQRPGIQHQQQQRQGDDHRLGHQPQDEPEQDRQVTSPARPFGIAHVGP